MEIRKHHGAEGRGESKAQQRSHERRILDDVKPGGYSLTQKAQGAGDADPQAPQNDPMNPVDSFEATPPDASGAGRMMPPAGGKGAGAQSNATELKDQLGFLYPSVGEILHTDPSKLDSGGGFTLSPQQQGELNDYGDKIKNVLAWNIMTQMLVKGSQMAMDSFLLAEKWQYEQQITVMQFMQTMAQMSLSYINNMSQSWDQLWSQYKQKQQEVQQGELQAISGGGH